MTGAHPAAGAFGVGLGGCPRFLAALALAGLMGLLAAGLWAAPWTDTGLVPGPTDAALYERIIADVRQGAPYYVAATRAQRSLGYPLRPFVTVRMPVLAVGLAALPSPLARRALLGVLAAATLVAWSWRLSRMGAGSTRLVLALGLLVSGVTVAFSPLAWPFHEVWAGLLISLSLALRRPGAWGLSLIVGLLAALTRDLAAAYLLAMAAMAWRDGERREAAAWIGAIAVFGLALAAHAGAVQAQLLAGDGSSQGWLTFGGWPFVLQMARWNALVVAAPRWLAAVLAPAALLGLALWRHPLGERLALIVFGYTAAFLFVGRPVNT